MTDTSLDRERRYLRPVTPLFPDREDEAHLAVYQWAPTLKEWVTGMSLCGISTWQGPLPAGTAVTCPQCADRRADYERWLAPGYQPQDDDPRLLRERIAVLEARIAALEAQLRVNAADSR